MDSLTANLTNPNKDIDIYNFQEVTSTNFFVSNTTELDPNGLFSEIIFGSPGTVDRQEKWGYINLNDIFMNPQAYYVFSRLKSSIANDIKRGLGRYYVDRYGELVKLAEGESVPHDAKFKEAGTSFEWLKRAWPYIEFNISKNMSNSAKVKRTFLKSFKIDQIFWDKYLIMPAFYRDVDFKSNKRNIINTMLLKLMRLADIIKNTDNLIFMDDPNVPIKTISHVKLQDQLMEIYLFFINKVSGANGFTNKHVVGKVTDYGARLVISPPDFNVEHYKDCEASFTHSSIPLAVVANIFSPFMIFGIKRWLNNYVSNQRFVNIYDLKTKQYIQKEIDPTVFDEFTAEKIKKQLNLYKKSKIYRLDPITLKGVNDERIPITMYHKTGENGELIYTLNPTELDNIDKIEAHYMTWCEFLFIITSDNLKDKGIYNTRYPMTTHNNTYCGLMNIIPANKYHPVYFNGKLYKRYPIVSGYNTDIEHMFTDSMRMFSVYPSAMGADFDGDQISTQGVFTKEANEDIKKHMNEISHVLGMNGKIIRDLPQVVKHGLYGLTYKVKK